MSVVDAAFYIKDRTIGAGNAFRDTVVRVCLSCCTVVVLICVAVLMYISFYYAYMPTVHHTQPVFLKFSSDCDSRPQDGLCSFPEANVSLSKGERILMRGQKYQVFLDLDMPYSPVNEKLGMFMVTVKFLSNSGKTVAASSRSCMLHFRSGPLKLMYSVFMALPLILGFTEEKQNVAVRLFENYVDDSYHPVTSVNIVILARRVEIYGALLRIEAQFAGLRFILFNWPVISSLVCILANFIVICIIFFLAYNAFTPEPVEQCVIEVETKEDGQERLYSEARRRDLGTSGRRTPVRVTPSPPPTQDHGRSRTPANHKRDRVPHFNYNASSMYLSLPCQNTSSERRLRSASFPSCRWESNDSQAASGASMGETIRSTPCTPRGDRASLHFGFQMGNTQSRLIPGYVAVKDNRGSKGKSEMDSQQSTKPFTMNKADSKQKVFPVNNKANTGQNGTVKLGNSVHEGRPHPKLSSYTIIEPKSGKKFNSFSDFKTKKGVTPKEKENQPTNDKQLNGKSSSTVKLKGDEHSGVVEEEKKSVLRRRSTNKTRSMFGLSLRKMIPKR